MVTPPDVRRTVDAVWRMESARIVAGLVRLVGDVGQAEDLAQDALLAALEQWQESGVPDHPGAWLTSVARRRAYDELRHRSMAEEKHRQMVGELGVGGTSVLPDAGLGEPIGDEVLRLVFLCCHPLLATESQVALTLRVVSGLRTEEIARAFLLPTATLAQRIVRAKRTLREARVPFELPPEVELPERLASVLAVVYLVFNEGYSASWGREWIRPELCREGLRLGRVLAGLAPGEPEVHGLVALMEFQVSRLGARVGPGGEAVLLMDQDRSRWDLLHTRRGLESLRRAQGLGGALGPYALQAAIAACHARARSAEETDWEGIAALYDALVQVMPSPVVELNRAVAVGRAYGAKEGLAVLERMEGAKALEGYHLLPAVRGDLLERLGRADEARTEFLEAASLTKNERERAMLMARGAGPWASLPADTELECLLETVESALYADLYRALPPELGLRTGIECVVRGPLHRFTARGLDHPMFNRVMGVGMEAPAEAVLVDAETHFRAAGVRRWMLQVLPHLETVGFREACRTRGLVKLRGWAKHVGPAHLEPHFRTRLRIVPAESRATDWAAIVADTFGMPADFVPWLASLAGRERWRLFVALDGDTPAAAAALYLHDRGPGLRLGALAFAGTREEYRGQGAQSALIARRFEAAREHNVAWIVSETDEELPDRPNPSYHNMVRLGLPVQYIRANWGPPKPVG